MPAVVDREICNGCVASERQECVFACPYDVFEMIEGKAFAHQEKCDDCKICVEVCPVRAIGME